MDYNKFITSVMRFRNCSFGPWEAKLTECTYQNDILYPYDDAGMDIFYNGYLAIIINNDDYLIVVRDDDEVLDLADDLVAEGCKLCTPAEWNGGYAAIMLDYWERMTIYLIADNRTNVKAGLDLFKDSYNNFGSLGNLEAWDTTYAKLKDMGITTIYTENGFEKFPPDYYYDTETHTIYQLRIVKTESYMEDYDSLDIALNEDWD